MQQSSIQNRQKPENAVPLVVIHSVREFDHLQEVANGASLEIVQLEPGIIHGEFSHLELSCSSIHSSSYNLSVRGHGPISEHRWSFVICPQRVTGTFNCEPLESRKVLAYRPGGEFEGTALGAFNDWTFTVEDTELRNAVQRLFRLDLPKFSGTCSALYPDAQLLEGLRRFAKASLTLDWETNASHLTSDLRVSLNRELTEQLARVVMSKQTENCKVNRTALSHSQIVRRSEDYLSAHIELPVTVMEICDAANVSERTLRNAYRSILGVNPSTYVKVRRLQKARWQLVQSTTDTATVTAIAHSSGFRHLGHFSQDYYNFFGESPSQTLAISRSK